jgi:hypothetical protein
MSKEKLILKEVYYEKGSIVCFRCQMGESSLDLLISLRLKGVRMQ